MILGQSVIPQIEFVSSSYLAENGLRASQRVLQAGGRALLNGQGARPASPTHFDNNSTQK